MTTRRRDGRWRVPLLSLGQLVAWGAMYYAFGLLIEPLSAQLSMSRPDVAGAFSLGLLVMGLCAWPVGVMIDRGHSRAVLTLGSALAALGLCLHAYVSVSWQLYAVWLLLGVAMSMCLYEPAFAMLIRAYPDDYRRRITMLTLLGGLASTVFWPLVAWLIAMLGWRGCLLALAAMQLGVAIIHWVAVPPDAPVKVKADAGPDPSRTATRDSRHDAPVTPMTSSSSSRSPVRSPVFLLLTAFFATNLMVMAGMHAHLPGMLQAQGLSLAATLAVAACMGPMQFVGRLIMFAGGAGSPVHRHAHLTVWMPPLAMMSLAAVGWAADSVGLTVAAALGFAGAALYGTGNGILTIVKATAVADLVGPERVATLNGIAAIPSAFARALSPWAVAWIWEHSGRPAVAWWALAGAALASALLFRVALSIAPKS